MTVVTAIQHKITHFNITWYRYLYLVSVLMQVRSIWYRSQPSRHGKIGLGPGFRVRVSDYVRVVHRS